MMFARIEIAPRYGSRVSWTEQARIVCATEASKRPQSRQKVSNSVVQSIRAFSLRRQGRDTQPGLLGPHPYTSTRNPPKSGTVQLHPRIAARLAAYRSRGTWETKHRYPRKRGDSSLFLYLRKGRLSGDFQEAA